MSEQNFIAKTSKNPCFYRAFSPSRFTNNIYYAHCIYRNLPDDRRRWHPSSAFFIQIINNEWLYRSLLAIKTRYKKKWSQ